MANISEIPLDARPQQFRISLGGIAYTMTVRYRNVTDGGWVLDIADASKNEIISGIPLVTGANLLAQYDYLGFKGRLWVQTTANPDAVPTFENLGTGAKLYFVTG